MYYFVLFYVTFECICIQTTATGYLPDCSWQIYQYQYKYQYQYRYQYVKQLGKFKINLVYIIISLLDGYNENDKENPMRSE
jgi:hypothetical protein